jgi:N-methylhydantoinase B
MSTPQPVTGAVSPEGPAEVAAQVPILGPVELEIIRNALVAAAEEMSVTVWRTSRSSVVREILDYSTCVFDADGASVAQAARMPVHLNSMASCLGDVLRDHLPIDAWHDGDVVLTNDPYSGGQHLSDWLAFSPVFVDGRRVAIVGVLVHHLDVGGGAPGSYDPEATEIFQEGIRIPPVKVVERGARNEALISTLLRNTREPANVGGDFASQLAALRIGVENLASVAHRYGLDTLAAATRAIQTQSEAAMRAAVSAVPEGIYTFEDFVDDDGLGTGPIPIRVRLEVTGDALVVDLTGSGPQVTGPVNCTMNMTSSAVVCGVMMAIGHEIPANAGVYRPITTVAPSGSVVNARSPAPVANRMAVGHRVVNAVMGAFAAAVPASVPASYYGVSYAYALAAEDDDGVSRVYFDLECGGWGAHPTADGASAFSCGFHNIANSPVEMIEHDHPVAFVEYALVPDSGGAGRTRGGLGLAREFRLDGPSGRFAANLDRFVVPPYGLDGGEPGRAGRLLVRRRDEDGWTALASKVVGVALGRGDRVRLETSGGGGHGEPRARARAALEADLAQGYVSAAGALAHYGIVRRGG